MEMDVWARFVKRLHKLIQDLWNCSSLFLVQQTAQVWTKKHYDSCQHCSAGILVENPSHIQGQTSMTCTVTAGSKPVWPLGRNACYRGVSPAGAAAAAAQQQQQQQQQHSSSSRRVSRRREPLTLWSSNSLSMDCSRERRGWRLERITVYVWLSRLWLVSARTPRIGEFSAWDSCTRGPRWQSQIKSIPGF